MTPSGLAGDAPLPHYLYSPGKANLRTVPVFQVNFPQPGQFVVRVGDVSNKITLRFLRDGQTAREVTLDAAPPPNPAVKPDYETTRFRPEYNSYEARFNKDYAINVPAGPHTIALDAAAGDWASISRITLAHYRSSRFPDIHIHGIASGRIALLWAQNAAHTWENVRASKPVPLLSGLQTTLLGLPDGHYKVEWWDTGQGKVTGRTGVLCAHGALPLHLPAFVSDIAARITPQP